MLLNALIPITYLKAFHFNYPYLLRCKCKHFVHILHLIVKENQRKLKLNIFVKGFTVFAKEKKHQTPRINQSDVKKKEVWTWQSIFPLRFKRYLEIDLIMDSTRSLLKQVLESKISKLIFLDSFFVFSAKYLIISYVKKKFQQRFYQSSSRESILQRKMPVR